MTIDTSIFKGYDIRGIFPQSLNNEIAYKIGIAYAATVAPKGEVMVGEDVRIHSRELKESLIRGLTEAGVDVLDLGLITTDMIYFGVGYYKKGGGIQTTASHNEAEWHGFKMVKEGPTPMTFESGISQIRDHILSTKEFKPIGIRRGTVKKMDIKDDYCDYILGWLGKIKLKPMKVVINANFGLAGEIFKRIVDKGKLPLELIPLNDKPDGTFPKGRPDPLIPENRKEFIELVKESKADLGIAWDADTDRVFFAADGGVFIEPYYLNTILVRQMLQAHPGEKVIYDPRYTWALIEAIKESSGVPILVRVGHSYIKEAMRKHNALFAVESSGHTYYRDYWYSDCGMIPVMQVLKFLSTSNKRLSEVIKPVMQKYYISGEINSRVEDKEVKMEEIAKRYNDAKISRLDGISIEYNDWRFCVRPSNTEPLLRLTLEARSEKLVQEKVKEVLDIIRS